MRIKFYARKKMREKIFKHALSYGNLLMFTQGPAE